MAVAAVFSPAELSRPQRSLPQHPHARDECLSECLCNGRLCDDFVRPSPLHQLHQLHQLATPQQSPRQSHQSPTQPHQPHKSRGSPQQSPHQLPTPQTHQLATPQLHQPHQPHQPPTLHQLPTLHQSSTAPSGRPSSLQTLPVEIIHQILSHLVHPRSRLPGLTETQSDHDFPRQTKLEIKNREDLTTLPDAHRWAADIFDFHSLRHPFHVLALTSKRLHASVETYCRHLVRTCNMFNLPFAHYDKYGPACVYPDLSNIIYRRLWLQHAPRMCIYCHVGLDCYPFPVVKRLIAACEDCFYRQTLTVDEVERQYHISIPTVLSSPSIRGPGPNSPWVLRIDVEAMAFRLYGTRAFHAAHADQLGKPCTICAITRFTPEFSASTRSERGLKRGTTRPMRRVVSLKRKGLRRPTRFA